MSVAEFQVKNDEANCGEKIHLYADARNGLQDAAIAVRWCICPSVFEVIKSKQAPNPHILLVVTNGDKEQRKIVPLEQEMEYFYFEEPGKHRIQATVLCTKDVTTLKRRLLTKDCNFYDLDILDGKGDLENVAYKMRYRFTIEVCVGSGEVNVDVAQEFFAKKPAEWLWNWVNLWYETRPRDQCQFRRRCMLAFSLQPFVVLLWIICICPIRFAIASFLKFGLGMRGIKFKPIYRPLLMETNDVWHDNEGSVFIKNSIGKQRPWFLLLLMPVFVIPLAAGFSGLKYWLFADLDFWWVPIAVITVIAGLVPLGYIFIFFAWLFEKIIEFTLGSPDDWRQYKMTKLARKKKQEKLAAIRAYDDTYSPLVCRGVPLKASLKALPKQRRTIYLRFMDLKTKVCKPFAK